MGHRNLLLLSFLFTACALSFACSASNSNNASTTATTTVTRPPVQGLKLVPRPQGVLDLMKQRGEQDQGKPVLKIVSPAEDAVISGWTVAVKLDLAGDLKGDPPPQDPTPGKRAHLRL